MVTDLVANKISGSGSCLIGKLQKALTSVGQVAELLVQHSIKKIVLTNESDREPCGAEENKV